RKGDQNQEQCSETENRQRSADSIGILALSRARGLESLWKPNAILPCLLSRWSQVQVLPGSPTLASNRGLAGGQRDRRRRPGSRVRSSQATRRWPRSATARLSSGAKMCCPGTVSPHGELGHDMYSKPRRLAAFAAHGAGLPVGLRNAERVRPARGRERTAAGSEPAASGAR